MLYSNSMEFAGWLRAELKQREMSQADLVRASGLSPAAVSRIMTGTRAPGLAACRAIAKALRLPIDVVYKNAGLMPISSERNRRRETIEFLAEQLDDKEYQELLDYIEFRISRTRKQ